MRRGTESSYEHYKPVIPETQTRFGGYCVTTSRLSPAEPVVTLSRFPLPWSRTCEAFISSVMCTLSIEPKIKCINVKVFLKTNI